MSSCSYNTEKREDEEEEVLTSYTCDTLFCSGKEGRQSRERRKSHRKKDEGLKDPPASQTHAH